MAMYLKLEASGSRLPDSMDWSGVESLPWFWEPFHNPVFAIVMAIFIPAMLATLLGYLIFRSRIQGIYFSIITQALALHRGNAVHRPTARDRWDQQHDKF